MKHLAPLLFVLAVLPSALFAQKTVKITMEDVKKKCENTPLKKRPRIVVARFNVTTKASPPELGDNMATMLTSALSQSNCFSVLEMLRNQGDLDAEMKHGEGEGASKANALKKGKSLTAQMIVNGEITEYSNSKKEGGIAIVRTSKDYVHLGFIIKLVDPETRSILFTQNFEVEGKTKSKTNLRLLGMESKGSSSDNTALADALDNGILAAVDYLTSQKDKIELPEVDEELVNAQQTTLSIKGMEYDGYSSMEEELKTFAKVKKVEGSFSSDASTFEVTHLGDLNTVLKPIMSKHPKKFKVLKAAAGKIELQSL